MKKSWYGSTFDRFFLTAMKFEYLKYFLKNENLQTGLFLFRFILHFLSYKRQPFLLLKRIASFSDKIILFLIASLTSAIIVHSSLLLCSCRVVNNHVKALFKEEKIIFFLKYFFHWLNCNNKEMISININIYLH